MDPRERADAILRRAGARGSYVVTPESAISPMDASSTLQIPRVVVDAIDDADPETTMVFSAREMAAIAQGAATQSVPSPNRPTDRPVDRAQRPTDRLPQARPGSASS